MNEYDARLDQNSDDFDEELFDSLSVEEQEKLIDIFVEDELAHVGVGHEDGGHSGRYPWGSGGQPYQNPSDFREAVLRLRNDGNSDSDIALMMGFGEKASTKLRASLKIAYDLEKQEQIAKVVSMHDKGMSNLAIARQLGISDHTVQSYLDPTVHARTEIDKNVSNMLKRQVDAKGYIDIGAGVEKTINPDGYDIPGSGISSTRLKVAVEMAVQDGYEVHTVPVEQLGTNHKTTVKVLCPPGTAWAEVMNNRSKITTIDNYSVDNGETLLGIQRPVSIDSKRVMVRYAEDGGKLMDGVIELRPGVPDLTLGGKLYGQARIAVDGTHYLKGMVVYANDLPEGVDIRFNTNKTKDVPMLGDKDHTVLKPLKSDPDNPFGATIRRQTYYDDPNGNYVLDNVEGEGKTYRPIAKGEKLPDDAQRYSLSVVNKVNEEGDWGEWSKTVSAQMLSKQRYETVKKQIDLSLADKKTELDELMSLTNPAIKQKLLESFADDCDANSVHLKTVSFPGQASHVILPIVDMPENQIYARQYKDGDRVCLVRYPHAGVFEIPELIVNNKNKTAYNMMGNATDAIGINPKVADKLSGADFDGDTVIVIPVNDKVRIKTAPTLEGLKDFDSKDPKYRLPEGAKAISENDKQKEMGKVTNLISDMTIRGANLDEIERAVKHSMVVIDAAKHRLDIKVSEEENNIAELKRLYQGGANKGASTLITKAKSEEYVPERVEGRMVTDPDTGKTRRLYVNPDTGEKLYTETEKTHKVKKVTKRNGEEYIDTPNMIKSTKMEEAFYRGEDAYSLSSGTAVENIYADYANKLRVMANTARKESISVKPIPMNREAKKLYATEIESLENKLDIALRNAPRERQALIYANYIVDAKRKANPDVSKEDLKKIKGQALLSARRKFGASKEYVDISEREWEAIQSGAISHHKLKQIIANAKEDQVRKYATPKTGKALAPAKLRLLKTMNTNGYSISEIADRLGVSTSTVSKYISGKED